MTFLYGALGLAFLWLATVTFLLIRALGHYKKLTTRTGAKGIDAILDGLLAQSGTQENDIISLKDALLSLETQSKKHIQRIGFVKFNPFERVGGDQSFVIALLDAHGTGIVKTFLYTREGVRVYVKQVRNGKPTEYELSDEEKEAIKMAQ